MFAICLAAALATPPTPTPLERTLGLVPPEPAILFILHDAGAHLTNLRRSPFAKWYEGQPGSVLADPDWANGVSALKFLSSLLGVTPEEFFRDILGDAVVLTYTPATGDRPEVGAVYVTPRNGKTLRKFIRQLDDLQLANGDLKAVEPVVHAGRAYSARRKKDGTADFVAERGGVTMYSADEATVRRFLTLPPAGDHFARLKSLRADDAVLTVLFAPRRFDAEFATRLEQSTDPGERAFLAQFRRLWASFDGVAVSLHLAEHLDVSVAAHHRRADLPPEFQAFGQTPRPAVFHGRTEGAMLELSATVDVSGSVAVLKSFLTPEAKAGFDAWFATVVGPAVGRDRLAGLVRAIGPEVELAVTPPPAGQFLPDVRLHVGIDDPTGKSAEALHDGLAVLAQFVRYEYNRTHADQIEVSTRDGITRAASPGFPAGLVPSYRVLPDRLTVAGRPELVTPPGTPEPPPDWVVRADAQALAGYLKANAPPLAGWLAGFNGQTATQNEAELRSIVGVLGALDRVEVRVESGPDLWRVRTRLTFVAPLK